MNTIATADLFDHFQGELQACELQFRDIGGRCRFYGRIRTVACQNDNVLIRKMLSEAGEGCVLVVDGGSSMKTALLGDMIAGLGQSNGWSGVIINGAVRDIRRLGEMDFGIKALGGNPTKSAKTGSGQIDIAVVFGGVLFEPGHWVYCDEDGIAVATRAVHESLP